EEPIRVHERFAAGLDEALDGIAEVKGGSGGKWPMIVLRTPKGWTGPKEIDGKPVENTWRAHQVPIVDPRENPEHLAQLEAWMRSYRPEELFTDEGAPLPELLELPPEGEQRMSASPHANGGELLRELRLPDFRDYAVQVDKPGTTFSEATRVLGGFLRDVVERNADNFRIFGPDETTSNRLGDVFTATPRQWQAEILPTDEDPPPRGQGDGGLSEHPCHGWPEGYPLPRRPRPLARDQRALPLAC